MDSVRKHEGWPKRRDSAKAKLQLGWEPKVRFQELVQIMVDADFASLQGWPIPDPLTPACNPVKYAA